MPLTRKRVLARHSAPVTRAAWTHDGRYAMTCGHDKVLRLWNPSRPEVNPDSGAAKLWAGDPSGRVELALHIKEYAGAHGHEVTGVAIARDNASFASCGGDRAVFLWDVTTGHVRRKLEGHTSRVNAVCFGGDDAVLVSGSYDQSVRLWDLRSRSRDPIQTLAGDAKDSVSCVAATGHEVVAGCVDGCVRVYDLRAGLVHTDRLGGRPVTGLSVSRDGRCLLASLLGQGLGRGGGVALLVEKATGQALNAYHGHVHGAYGLEASFAHATDAHVVSASEDGFPCVYDLVSADLVQRLVTAPPQTALTEPGAASPGPLHRTGSRLGSGGRSGGPAVVGVACHPSEAKLLASCLDGTAVLWEGGF